MGQRPIKKSCAAPTKGEEKERSDFFRMARTKSVSSTDIIEEKSFRYAETAEGNPSAVYVSSFSSVSWFQYRLGM